MGTAKKKSNAPQVHTGMPKIIKIMLVIGILLLVAGGGILIWYRAAKQEGDAPGPAGGGSTGGGPTPPKTPEPTTPPDTPEPTTPPDTVGPGEFVRTPKEMAKLANGIKAFSWRAYYPISAPLTNADENIWQGPGGFVKIGFKIPAGDAREIRWYVHMSEVTQQIPPGAEPYEFNIVVDLDDTVKFFPSFRSSTDKKLYELDPVTIPIYTADLMLPELRGINEASTESPEPPIKNDIYVLA